METHSNERVEGPIDYPITDEEFEAAINKLKANKSPVIDNILKEVIRIGKEAIKGHLVNLFNRILDTGKYPALWSFGLIVPIHKKDDRSKVEKYRGITLLCAQGKIFTSILNNRLHEYVVQKGILKAEQCGFRKMHGTVDSIFTLKTLIDKYVKSKPQKHRNLLFPCFVDFRKAFDCIPRQKLVYKLNNITRDMCFLGGGTHITRDMCFPGGGTHITRDMCFPGRGTHITRDMCFPGRGTHFTRDMCFLGRGTHITRDMCFLGRETHIPLGICVSRVGEHISLGI